MIRMLTDWNVVTFCLFM